MAFDFGMLSGMLPGGQSNVPSSYGFDGPPPAIDPLTGMPMPVPKLPASSPQQPAPFGPFPAVPLPGMQADLQPSAASAAPQSGGALPPWLAEQTSAPVGLGAPMGLSGPVPTPQPRPANAPPAMPVDDGNVLPPNSTPATNIPSVPQQASGAPPTPGLLDRLSAASHNLSAKPGLPGIFDAISGIQSGARTDPRGQQIQAQNQTFAALVKRGMDPDVASAVISNPEMLKQVLPSLFGGKKLMNVNGVLVDEATGKQVADYSDATKWQVAKVSDPNTGIETSVLVQPGTGATRQITPGSLQQATAPGGPAQGGPVTQRMALPPEVKNMPPSLQFKNAPDGSTATLGGRPVIKRNGRWEYAQ